MKKQRRIFTAEFKQEAASMVLDQQRAVSEVCQALDIGDTTLRRWIDQLQEERGGATPKGKALTPEQQKIQALEARIKELEEDKVILKKATALLMSDSIKPTRRSIG
jgi:transposase